MLIRNLIRFFLLSLSFRIVEEGGGGGVSDMGSGQPSDVSTVGSEPGPAAAPVAAPAPAPTMLDAINAHFDAQKTDQTGQPRDQQGRFAPKNADGTPIVPALAAPAAPGAPVVPGAPAVKPAPVPGAPDDLTVMPEGLQPKAQERFQKLANTVKETTAERDEARNQVSYVRETFQKNGIQQPQFEQAAAVIGMLNTGNLRGALQALDEQRRHIALALGEPLPGVDALSEHPDLRQAVDNMQLTEVHAMEMARARMVQSEQQRQQVQVQQTQQAKQQEQQAFQTGLKDVDDLCKHLAATDMDYNSIEGLLLPSIKDLLQGVPPNQWKNTIQTQYSLMKRTASTVRGASPSQGGSVLRPTGQASPGAAPKTMFEAMWNRPQG